MSRSKRILFTFDPRSEQNLRKLTDAGGFPSASDAVRDALRMARTLQEQEQLGFTEVVVRNPETNQEKVIVAPWSGMPPTPDPHGEAKDDGQPQLSPAEETCGR